MGYYPLYQRGLMPRSEIDWTSMTHLAVAAVLPRRNGSVDTSYYVDPTRGPEIATALATAARRHGVVPMLMVGGWGAHNGFAAAATDHLGRLVRQLVAVARAEGFAGLDLDWEPVVAADHAPLLALVTALRAKAPDLVLTMPVGWVTTTHPTVPSFYGVLAQSLDRVDVMTYGMAGAWGGWKTWHSSALTGAGPHTPSDVAVNVTGYEAAGVPAAELGIGTGFYGTCWAGGVTGPRQRVGSSTVVADDNVMSYRHIVSRYYSSAAYHYDTNAQAPYLGFRNPAGPQHCTFVSYENRRSIAAKGAYAERHGLGAVIVWTVNEAHVKGAAPGKTDPLLHALRRSFH
jgi:chitinase